MPLMQNNIFTGKIFTRTVLLVSFVSFFTDIASEMLYPVMPSFLKSIGFSVLMIGVLEGIAECTAGLSKGYFGQFSDKLGRRVPFIQTGYSLSAISKPLMALFSQPLWIFFSRALDRLGKGIRTNARDALLSAETTAEHKGKVFGFHRGMDTAGAAIGPIIALVFLYYFPSRYQMLFLIAFIPGIAAVMLTMLIKERQIPEKKNTLKINFFSYLSYWKQSTVQYKMLVTGLLVFTLINSSDMFLLLSIKNHTGSDYLTISCYIFYNITYALLSFPMGILADKIGMRGILTFGFICFALVYVGFGFASVLSHFILLFFLYALFAAATEGISKAWISNVCRKEETATALGFYTSFASVASFAASSLGGLIWIIFGAQAMFIFSGSAAILVAFYFFIVKNRFRTISE
jgi:MFS family permease